MPYIVRIETGKGKNKSISQSLPLKDKEAVRRYVKRTPVGRGSTPVKIRNLNTKKTKTLTKNGAETFGLKELK